MLRQIKSVAIRLWKDEQGASLLEYSVLVGLIVAGAVVSITAIGVWTTGRWNTLSTILLGTTPP